MSALIQSCRALYQGLEEWKGEEYITWMKTHSPHFPLLVAAVYLLFTLLVPWYVRRSRDGQHGSGINGGDADEKPSPSGVETVEIKSGGSETGTSSTTPAARMNSNNNSPPPSASRRGVVHAEPLVRSEILKPIIAIWNIGLSLFSVAGFLCSAPILYRIVVSEYVPGLAAKYDSQLGQVVEHPKVPGGLYTSLCYWNANIFQDGVSGFWLLAFDLSKIPEMMDTVFLILQNKPVAFIHWYHHITVMLFCWHAHVTYISNGLWFAVMNMGVHSIMYFYYFMCAIGFRKAVRRFAPFITMMQLAQMVAGLVLVTYTGYLHWTHPRSCETNANSIWFGLCMYGSYFVLFVQFFRKAYLAGSREKRRQRPPTPISS